MNNNINGQHLYTDDYRDIQEESQSVNIADYYYILLKHKWVIIAWFIIIVSLTLFFTLRMTPIYQAVATMVIENEYAVSPATGEKIDYGGYINQQMAFNTHVRLIKSRQVLENVIKELNLEQLLLAGKEVDETLEINFFKKLTNQLKRNIAIFFDNEKQNPEFEDKKVQLIDSLSRKISIDPVRDTHILNIKVLDDDPQRARNIANSLTRSYIEFNAAGKLKSSQDMLNWMTGQLYEVKKKLEDAEAEFQAYKQQEKIFSIEGKQQVITQQIQDFNDAYLDARNKRLELDSKLSELRRIIRQQGNTDGARLFIDNALTDTLYKQLLDAEVELNRLSKIYKEKHPKIVQMQSKIEKSKRKLEDELKKEMGNLKAQRAVLYSKEKVLQKTIADFENDAMETNKKELQYKILERNVNTNRKLYDTLLTKIKASNIDEKIDVSNIRIAEQAVVPRYPVKPDKRRNIILGAVLGLMFGIGIAFLREYLDQSLRTEEDIQKYLDLPVLSVIPEAKQL